MIIAFLIPSLSSGGMQRVMSEIVSYGVRSTNNEIHLIIYGKNPEIFYSIPAQVIVHRHNLCYRSDSLRVFYTFQTMKYIRSKVKKINPDTILSFGEIWNNFVLLSLTGLKYPIFISDRSKPGIQLGGFQSFLRKHLYRYAAGYVAQTRFAAEIAVNDYLLKNIEIIGNPIRGFHHKVVKRKNVIVSVGRLISSKNHDKLIKLFASLRLDDWKLIIIGGDSNRQNNYEKLTALIVELKMQDRIILTNTIKNVDDFLRMSSIFAFMSDSEGFPNALGEAMSAGLACIAFDCTAGPSDLIEDGKNGVLIPLFDYEQYKNKLLELVNNQKMRQQMGENAIVKIRESFSVEVICKKYYSFICNNSVSL